MNRRLPVNILQILERWLDISITCVKWGNQVSHFMALKAWCQTGRAMSPCLFAIFIDDIVIKFKTLGRFSNSEYVCTNIFLYADDIVFLSPSLSILQDMLHLCEYELSALDMCLMYINPYVCVLDHVSIGNVQT